MYPNQQTRFATDAYQSQPMRIDVNNPPVRFQFPCAPWLQQYTPYITGMMIDLISADIQGPVSMHFFNHMAQNQWNNPDFAQEVANATDFVYLKSNGQQDPNAIGPLLRVYITLRRDVEVSLEPGLRAFIAPQDMYRFDQATQQFQQEMAQVMNLRNGGPQRQMGGGFPPPAAYAPPGSQMPAPQGYPMQQPMGVGMPMQAQMQAPMGYQNPNQSRTPGGGRTFGNRGGQPQQQQQQMQPMQPPQPQVQPVQQPQVQPASSVSASPDLPSALFDEADIHWLPSKDNPHPILHNPVITKILYGRDNNQLTSHPTRTNMDMIDYDRHAISTLFGKPMAQQPLMRDNTKLIREIKEASQDALEETKSVDETGRRQEEYFGLRNTLSAFTLDQGLLDLEVEMRSRIDPENMPMVFQCYLQVFTPIMGDKSEYHIIHKLAGCSTYVALREEVRAASKTASPKLLTDIHLKLTALMNSILTDRLSILPEDLEVENFVEDLDALFADLKKMGQDGDRLIRAFTQDQAERIQAMFDAPDIDKPADLELHEKLVDDMLSGAWNDRDDLPAFTFYGPTVRVTFLNVVSHDLLVDGIPGIANVITRLHSPVLIDLAESLFRVTNAGDRVDRQLVVTQDGRVLEILQSSVIERTFLLKLVK